MTEEEIKAMDKKVSHLFDEVWAEVWSEWIADYCPGIRVIEACTMTPRCVACGR